MNIIIIKIKKIVYSIEKYESNKSVDIKRYYESGNIKYEGNYIYSNNLNKLLKNGDHKSYYDIKNKKIESIESYSEGNLIHIILFDKKNNVIKEYGPDIGY